MKIAKIVFNIFCLLFLMFIIYLFIFDEISFNLSTILNMAVVIASFVSVNIREILDLWDRIF